MDRSRQPIMLFLCFFVGCLLAYSAERVATKRKKNERVQEIVQAIREINATVQKAVK